MRSDKRIVIVRYQKQNAGEHETQHTEAKVSRASDTQPNTTGESARERTKTQQQVSQRAKSQV